jgi:diacylglycerol kinase family enzyme
MLILVNPNSGGGTALEKWQRIEHRVADIVGSFETAIVDGADEARALVASRLAAGETRFVAAGGDGTVNLVLSTLVDAGSEITLRGVFLGAIGLGSSNDFHKPFDAAGHISIDGIPARLDFTRGVLHDVGLVTFHDDAGYPGHRIWLINSSIGVTAEANGLFNRPTAVLGVLKRWATPLAIVYAAVHSILRRRTQELAISIDGSDAEIRRISNLGIVKNPHFAGSLRYDSPHDPGDGHFWVHTLDAMSIPRLLVALSRLATGKSSDQPGATSQLADSVKIDSDRPFAIEGDGEVVYARAALFRVMPRLLRVCA